MRDGPGERVEGGSGSPNRVWGRAGVLTERMGGGGRRDRPGERVEGESGSPYRVWGRDGVLTERRGRRGRG